jgi:phage tail-like protein
MKTLSLNPCGAFHYLVSLGGGSGLTTGGFSAASGLDAGRLGNLNTVVLKRGRIQADNFLAWIMAARYGAAEPRRVTVAIFEGGRRRAYALRNARPAKWTGPTLAAKGSEVAIEELVLTCEGIELE